ncbi:hypothetical protein LOTGIDRAFT_239728 [Lottia gigantea]|uniref:Sushi domain-containing protein n=1 Tax=Lottia gigantea TaxID=225164 RepID=V4B4F4_LOTGI|nr:hypothetical protein LOTGIDRAFT_239728 [Lottia gigantea]ESP02341.1 hypothetical protein LOTGIDRAFT_239728 [Lottia gigantea]
MSECCITYPNITDANFDKDCNGNVVITCNEGFKMVQGLECVEEEWKYQNPICKRTECQYKYTNETGLEPYSYKGSLVSDSAECDENCANDIRCSTSTMTWFKRCLRYETPFIFVSYEVNEDQCIEKCNEMSECKTIGTESRLSFSCFLFNVTLGKIPNNLKRPYRTTYTVAQKICE